MRQIKKFLPTVGICITVVLLTYLLKYLVSFLVDLPDFTYGFIAGMVYIGLTHED